MPQEKSWRVDELEKLMLVRLRVSFFGVLFDIKKKQFKYEVSRQQEHIRREQLGAALSQSRNNDFWKVVATSTNGARSNAPCVSYCSRDADIANVFDFMIF